MKRILSAFCLVLALTFGASDGRAQAVPQSKAQIALSFAPLVKQTNPAVVNIYTQKTVKQRMSPIFNDPLFMEFFGSAMPPGMTRERMEHSLGSGVVIRSDGLIVTSRHVVANADQIRVVLSDRREFDAHIIMQDERSDLAVLRLDSKGETFPFIELRDSDEAQVGDLVLAIGNPFGVGQTVTMGIISALSHKSIGSNDLGYFIQTDAAINPGNSGGALITMDGKLIGINAAIYSRDGGNMGIGFAVPSNMVKILIGAVSQGKTKLTHPWTGIDGQEVSQDIALSLGMSQPIGYLVKSLHPASPAAKAGLKPGDVIVSVNGHEIDDPEAFRYRTTALAVGTEAELGILRNGQKSIFRVPMIAPPETPPRNETVVPGHNPATGAKIANLSPAVAEELGLQSINRGVVVMQVKRGTIASRVGLAPGDIIREVNGENITDVDNALKALAHEANGGWRIKIKRGNEEVMLMFGG